MIDDAEPRVTEQLRSMYWHLSTGNEVEGIREVEDRFWGRVKYLAVSLTGVSAAAGVVYAMTTPQFANLVPIVTICLAMVVASIAGLWIPNAVLVTHPLRPLFFGVWSAAFGFNATVLAALDQGIQSPFITMYVLAMILAGMAAPRVAVLITGVICMGGFLWLHYLDSIPMNGGSAFAAAMLLLVLAASAWIAETQQRRAEWLLTVTDDLVTQMATVHWIANSAPSGLVVSDAAGRIVLVNPAACSMLGRTKDELMGAPAHLTFHHSKRDGTPIPIEECSVIEAIESRTTMRLSDEVYWRSDGTYFEVEGTSVPTPDGGIMVAFEDITERLASQRLKDEFVAVVSHELRTPLTSVRGALGLLVGGVVGELSPEVTRLVRIAATNTDRLSRLINDILDVEHLDSGKAVLEREAVDIADLVGETVAEMRLVGDQHGVTIRNECDRVMVNADPDRVEQVLVNLLGNAIKFSAPGDQVVVTAVADDGVARIDVIDRGRGIPEELRRNIFNRFEQVDSSDSREKGGVGLGLAISEGIVRQHGGRIWVESSVGMGSTFSFTLPLAVEEVPSVTEGPGPVVLVIDGDSGQRDGIAEALIDGGYQAVIAATGREGVALAASTHPMAVLLDAELPDMDVWEVVRSLRADADTLAIAVVLMGQVSATGEELPDSVQGFIDRTTIHTSLLPTVGLALRKTAPHPIVLIVEDDRDLAEVLSAGFAERGVETVLAGSCADARRFCEETLPDVILLDLILPDGCGAELVAWLHATERIDLVGLAVYTAVDVGSKGRAQMHLAKGDLFVKSRVPPKVVLDRVVQLLDATSTDTTGVSV